VRAGRRLSDRVFRCRKCGTRPDRTGWLPRLRRGLEGHRRQPWDWLPKNLLEERWIRRTVRSCAMFPHSEREKYRLTITLGDITEEEFRVLELIDAERQEPINPRTAGLGVLDCRLCDRDLHHWCTGLRRYGFLRHLSACHLLCAARARPVAACLDSTPSPWQWPLPA